MPHETAVPDVQFVARPGPFMSLLEPGDVLLFDSIHPISGLIKFGENRPVNHAALYVGDGEFVQVTSHAIGSPAIQRSGLDERLEVGRDRTVTALRHRDARARPDAGPAIAAQAGEMGRDPSTYSYLDLITLVLPSFFRSYDRYLRASGGMSNRFAGALESFVPAVLSVLEADGASGASFSGGSALPIPPTAVSLTCSEFVYRCFQRADHPIEIAEPLASWSGRWSRSRDISDPSGGIIDFHEALLRGDEPSRSGPIDRGAMNVSRRDLARRACRVLLAMVQHNLARHKYEPSTASGGALPDAVTPRDLWCSRSLRAHAVFHLPPGELDADLDEPHH